MTIIDISPPISPRLAVYPGDTPFSRDVLLDFVKGDHLTLSSMGSTLHLGAHADAPSHYHPQGVAMADRGLAPYIGPCELKQVSLSPGARLLLKDLKGWEPQAPRVIFRTDSFTDPEKWRGDFNSLSPEVIEWLAEKGVTLVGIDTPSVDPVDSKDLESHQALYRNDFSVLEGLVLTDVKEGPYFLVALPLKIEDADASPVRAVLLTASPQI